LVHNWLAFYLSKLPEEIYVLHC